MGEYSPIFIPKLWGWLTYAILIEGHLMSFIYRSSCHHHVTLPLESPLCSGSKISWLGSNWGLASGTPQRSSWVLLFKNMKKERKPLILEMFLIHGPEASRQSGKGGTWEVFREMAVVPQPHPLGFQEELLALLTKLMLEHHILPTHFQV